MLLLVLYIIIQGGLSHAGSMGEDFMEEADISSSHGYEKTLEESKAACCPGFCILRVF